MKCEWVCNRKHIQNNQWCISKQLMKPIQNGTNNKLKTVHNCKQDILICIVTLIYNNLYVMFASNTVIILVAWWRHSHVNLRAMYSINIYTALVNLPLQLWASLLSSQINEIIFINKETAFRVVIRVLPYSVLSLCRACNQYRIFAFRV